MVASNRNIINNTDNYELCIATSHSYVGQTYFAILETALDDKIYKFKSNCTDLYPENMEIYHTSKYF